MIDILGQRRDHEITIQYLFPPHTSSLPNISLALTPLRKTKTTFRHSTLHSMSSLPSSELSTTKSEPSRNPPKRTKIIVKNLSTAHSIPNKIMSARSFQPMAPSPFSTKRPGVSESHHQDTVGNASLQYLEPDHPPFCSQSCARRTIKLLLSSNQKLLDSQLKMIEQIECHATEREDCANKQAEAAERQAQELEALLLQKTPVRNTMHTIPNQWHHPPSTKVHNSPPTSMRTTAPMNLTLPSPAPTPPTLLL